MDGPVVRRATPDDAAGIARVHVRGWQVGYRGLLADEVLDGLRVDERTSSWRERLTHPDPTGATTSVAVAGDRVLGFTSAGTSRDDDAPAGTHEVWALYVDPDRWRAGVGRLLADALVEDLAGAGALRVTLWVLSANARARAFYESQGWVVEGATRVERRPGPPPLELVETRYARVLAPT